MILVPHHQPQMRRIQPKDSSILNFGRYLLTTFRKTPKLPNVTFFCGFQACFCRMSGTNGAAVLLCRFPNPVSIESTEPGPTLSILVQLITLRTADIEIILTTDIVGKVCQLGENPRIVPEHPLN